MRVRCAHQAVLGILLVCQFSACLGKEAPDPNQSSKYLNAVREFADNVLKYGRDTYGPKHTPLFVDGLNIHTHEPVKWISPKGDLSETTETEEWILSNLALQQNLFRTLDSLTAITGDPKYRQAAMEAIGYAFENLRSPNGLLYWGEVHAYDAESDTDVFRCDYHDDYSFKAIYPYYQLMWEVDPSETEKLIETIWAAHILDWSNLDMNRIAPLDRLQVTKGWDHEYKGGPVYFESEGISFCTTGGDLCYAACMLSKLSGKKEPLVWAKRIAHRYVETRDPRTGFWDYVYTGARNAHPLAEYFKGHTISPVMVDFGGGDPANRRPFLPIYILSPGLLGNYGCLQTVWYFMASELFGDEGQEFKQWALEELTARGKAAYRREDNSWVPMLADGTKLEGFVCPKDMPGFARKGSIIKAWQADLTDFWAYALGYRVTSDSFLWEIARNIIRGNSLGDIGAQPGGEALLDMSTDCHNAHALLGFLCLYERTQREAFLDMARRIGDNILAHKFHKGFFVASNKHTYARFDVVESLSLLHLFVAIHSEYPKPPSVWPSDPRFAANYRYKEPVYDVSVIYTLTKSNEPPVSISEAAAIGDIELVRSLIAEGENVDFVETDDFLTPLYWAVRNGHVEVVRLLLSEGANMQVVGDWRQLTPLHLAAEKGHKEIAELLIANGADVTVKNQQGRTPLHMAALQGNREIVEALVAHGADVNVKDNRGITPLVLAQRRRRTDIVGLLTKVAEDQKIAEEKKTEKEPDSSKGQSMESQKDEQSFEEAILSRDLARVKGLIAQGADVNIRDSRGNTPLLQAMMIRRLSPVERLSLVKMLISAGADVNAKNRQGNTPLNLAMRRGYTEIVELLTKAVKEQTVVHGVAVTKVSATTSCVQGDTVSIIVTLDNRGDRGESCAVKFMDATNDREIAHQSATIHSKYWGASEADLTFTGEVEDETEFGNWCNANGDVNGDGFNDLLITAHHYPSMSVSRGRAYLYYGGPQMDNTPDKKFTGEESGDTLGGNAGFLVDMNNDGYADVILGARHHNNRGRVYIFYGGKDMDEEPDIIIDPPAGDGTDLSFGRGGMHPGDFNGDGIMDLVCSAVRYNAYMGRVYLYYGPLATDTTVDKIFTGEGTDDTFGAIMGVGDVNGDKCDDLLIATRYYPANTGVGKAYFYYGAPGTSMDITCDVIFDPPDGGKNEFGSSADVFDIDNDGLADVIIGARRFDNSQTNKGRAYFYWGRTSGFDNTVGLTITGEAANSALGGDFINCGYADDNQYGDILITAYAYNREQSRAYLYSGSPQGDMDAEADHIFTPEPGRNGVFRSALADLNNDGHGDVVMAGAYYNNLQGRAWLWYGPFASSSIDVTLNWDTTNASIGKHTLKVEIPSVPGEQNTEDNIKTVTIEVKEPAK